MNQDLISRRAAVDALNEYFARIGKLKRRGLNKGEKAISLDTVETIKTLPSVQPQRWIPVTEALPEKDGRYLITGKMETVYSLDFEDGRWYGGIKPIAWCELPEPYKEEQDE